MMKNQNYMESLKNKHTALDMEIQKEMSKVNADQMKIAEMKKQKLKLKEEMDMMMKKST